MEDISNTTEQETCANAYELDPYALGTAAHASILDGGSGSRPSNEGGALNGCERKAAESTMEFLRWAFGAVLFFIPVGVAAVAEHFTGHNLAAIGIAAGVVQVIVYSVVLGSRTK